jgi:hydroxyisourate hydrolase
MSKLSTHVLDLTRGGPAAKLKIELWQILLTNRTLLKTVTTNADGRTDEPLLEGPAFETGQYEIVFHVGAYFGSQPGTAFLQEVPVRFHVTDATANYHVPLLTTPWAYSTYRGS